MTAQIPFPLATPPALPVPLHAAADENDLLALAKALNHYMDDADRALNGFIARCTFGAAGLGLEIDLNEWADDVYRSSVEPALRLIGDGSEFQGTFLELSQAVGAIAHFLPRFERPKQSFEQLEGRIDSYVERCEHVFDSIIAKLQKLPH